MTTCKHVRHAYIVMHHCVAVEHSSASAHITYCTLTWHVHIIAGKATAPANHANHPAASLTSQTGGFDRHQEVEYVPARQVFFWLGTFLIK